jgi:acyl-coenzyme A thioesterase PaaI-like protein
MILRWWKRLSPLPGGKLLFSRLIGRFAPYSGSIGANVEELGPGHARVTLCDRRGVRNHLRSVHAVALMNLAELSSGLALITGLSDEERGIVTKFEIEFVKKARGLLQADCHIEIPKITGRLEYQVPVEVKDAEGHVVCRARAFWTLDRKERKPA